MSKRYLYLLAGSLSVIGLLLFLYKALVLGFPLLPSDVVQRWDLEARLRIVADRGPVKLALGIPTSTRRALLLLVDERFVSHGFGLSMKREASGRQLVWSRCQASGEQILYYRATVQLAGDDEPPSAPASPPQPGPVDFTESERTATQAPVDEVRAQSADAETLVTQLLEHLAEPGVDPNAALLLGAKESSRNNFPILLALSSVFCVTAPVI